MKTIQTQKYRKGIDGIEKAMEKMPGSVTGKDLDAKCPLRHFFCDGLYVREIFMPKGTLIVSKIHKYKHPYFILKGETSVITEDGVKRYKAPYMGITERGTKRALFMHEDTIWTTVHATDSKDLEVIEKQIIAKTFDEISFENTIKVHFENQLETRRV